MYHTTHECIVMYCVLLTPIASLIRGSNFYFHVFPFSQDVWSSAA